MLEALAVLAVVGLLGLLGLVAPLLPAAAVLWSGWGLVAAGLLLGVPTGFWYHVRLRAALAARRELPPRWWLRPVALHVRLLPEELPAVQRWFYAGGLGFALVVLGCALVGVGVVLEGWRAGVF